MQFSLFSHLSRVRPATRTGARFAGLLAAFAVATGLAGAQIPNPAPLTEQPSQRNPAPRAGGDAQNRNRAHDDKYWGITDANRRWFETPFSRIPDPLTVARGNGRLVYDGWQFPRLANQDVLRQPLDFGIEQFSANAAPAPGSIPAGTPGLQFSGALWLPPVVAPSTQFLGDDGNYQRAPATPRPNGAITNNEQKVIWFPRVPGDANTIRRYAIRIYLPTPEPLPEDGTPRTENRVEDARYTVIYQTRNPDGTLQTRNAVVLVPQSGSGFVTLNNSSGQPILFPMASEASNLPAANRPRVELDNTSAGDISSTATSGTFVIADQIQFVPASEYGEIKAPTTVTPIHGGRKIPRPAGFALGAPYANQLFQAAWTDLLVSTPYTATDVSLLNDSMAFINNPRQLDYAANPEAGLVDTVYTDNTSAFFQPFEAWNPSTLFQGPRSLIDDQTDPTEPGFEAGRLPGDRSNNQRYEVRNTDPDFDATNNPAGRARPLFSHMQVLVPRTEYVPDPTDSTGLRSIAVGCVYSVDWTTGATIWRFPDRTFLPNFYRGANGALVAGQYRDQYGNTVARAGSRNPNTTKTFIRANGSTGTTAVPTVPGIGAYDKNSDGYISDDEVYIVGQGSNGSGALEAGITIVPRLRTRSVGTTIPRYNAAWNPYTSPTPGINSSNNNSSPISGVVIAPEGRYANVDAEKSAVETGVAIIASDNGVLYAIDAYGNNDNRYYTAPGTLDAQGNQPTFGTYHAGSTNVMWSFSETIPVRENDERIEEYNLRLKRSVPATGAWGRSTPVLAYENSDSAPTADVATPNRSTGEPRLFVGNSNGVIYALNPVVNASRRVEFPIGSGIFTFEGSAPYRKDEGNDIITGLPSLRWWFETQGAITAAPAVSLAVQPERSGLTPPNQKGVYVTSNDGRVYCLDWAGPVTKQNHNTQVNYAGTAGSAERLNDNFRFHNGNSTDDFARADGEEGDIRPRWVFPSRYRDITGTANSEIAPIEPADESLALGGGALVERQARLAPINAAPVLMDFPYVDSAGNASLRSYCVVVANDLNGSDSPVTGRVYLLDQVGDRRDFSVKPVERDNTAIDGTQVAFGQPEDMYAPSDYVFSDATPAWAFRPVYARYNNAGTVENVQLRNRPNQLITPTTVPPNTPALGTADDPTNRELLGYPEKRVSPTVFVGGVSGRVFALDIDPLTGLFLRWRGSIADTRLFTPLPSTAPNQYTDARNLPANVPVDRRLSPANPVLEGITVSGGYGTLSNRPVLARTISALNADDVSAITISGGPLQNRNHPYANDPILGDGPTIPLLPTNDAPNLQPFVPYTFGLVSATTTPTVPITAIRPFFWTGINVAADAAGNPKTDTPPWDFTGFDFLNVAAFDLRGRFTNQDIDDPTATTGGSNASLLIPGASSVFAPELNRSYQYPVLAVTTTDGSFTLISTEIEGLDADDGTNLATNPQTDNDDAFLGWALASDPIRANATRPLLLSLRGPGGAGTQVTMITNAYYGAMDPGFRNDVQKLPADASATNFPRYPWNEPRNVGTLTTAPFGDPRPRFEPRSLYAGNTASPDGPDTNAATGDGYPQSYADAHTGRTGLPLDLRGLFYDKRFAANTTGDNTNDDGLFRLPAYSGIGEELAIANRRLRLAQNTAFVNNVNNTGALYAPMPDGTPDVPRDNSTGATSPYRTDPFKLFPGALDPTDTTIRPEADINPPGTNVSWLFLGGTDGVFYGYTPNRFTDPNFGGGLSSGFAGGVPNQNLSNRPGQYGSPKVLFVDEATFNALQTSGARPALSDSLQAKGINPVYEYGESVYAVIYDIGPAALASADTSGNGVLDDEDTGQRYPSSVNIVFEPTGGNVQRTTGQGPQRILIPAAVNIAGGYPYDPSFATSPQDPALGNLLPSELKTAYVRIPITTDSVGNGRNGGRVAQLGNGAAQSTGWTPGVLYRASLPGATSPSNLFDLNGNAIAATGSVAGVGATERQALENQPPAIQIANPLAIQAFLIDSANGNLASVADPEGLGRVYNGIGPFAAQSDFAAGVKTRVATPANVAAANPIGFDPDRFASEYSQALANGNTIVRLDPNLYEAGSNGTIRNTRFGQRLVAGNVASDPNAGAEPSFYLPVAASAGLIDSGKTNSTDVTNARRNLRIANRSLQRNLGKLRVDVLGDALFRSWPGERPNVRPADGTGTFAGQPNLPARSGTGNGRLTPTIGGGVYAMNPAGVVNGLPWEQPTSESLPWERISPATASLNITGNTSRDYPDIGTSPGGKGKQAVKVVAAGVDAVQTDSVLTASIGTGTTRANLTVSAGGNIAATGNVVTPPLFQRFNYDGTDTNYAAGRAAVEITVPNYQPANLVAMHSLTSTYEQPSAEEDPGQGLTAGVLQLPRAAINQVNRAVTTRALRVPTTPGAFTPGATDPRTITPMGYSVKMRAYLDINGNGRFDNPNEPYREFETWFGVPVNITMEQANGPISIPGTANSALAHGFGQQNGYLGYGLTLNPPAAGLSYGFLPRFLRDAADVGDPYRSFFAPVTVQSKSNVNLWNVRASQKIERYNNLTDAANAPLDGVPFNFFAMQGQLVNSRFGVLSQEVDPQGIMPNVVTSLDKRFDTAWDTYIRNLPGYGVNSPEYPNVTLANGQSRYQAYYAGFGGRHPLHKPAPGSSNDTGTVLSVPDLPSGSLPPNQVGAVPPPPTVTPSLGIAVPLGTPSGTYSNVQSGTPLVFFEDHDTYQNDTNVGDGYRSIPVPNADATNLTITPAGPLYRGQNLIHPGTIAKNASPTDPGSQTVLFPARGEGILRPRRLVSNIANQPAYEYLPSTTQFGITLTVGEAPLTGGVADQALSNTFPQSVVTGLLPGIDSVPRFDITNIGANEIAKPVSSLSPAAYRTATGNIVLFYNANVASTGTSTSLLADLRTGAPFKLLRTALAWDNAAGTWRANASGEPIDGSTVFNQANPGSWFEPPAGVLPAKLNSDYESLLSPFVMHDPRLSNGIANASATLVAMNVIPTQSGAAQYIPYFAPLNASGEPGAFTPLLATTGETRLDGSLRRYTPRGVVLPAQETGFVTYYGGGAGKNNILYVPFRVNDTGAIVGTGRSEWVLTLPSAVISASDPMPVVRRYNIPGVGEQEVVDVYYSAVLRTGESADLCVTRYRVRGTRVGARLIPIDLPRQVNEELTGVGRAFKSRNFGWVSAAGANAPVIRLVRGANITTIGPGNWQVDAASRLLYQTINYPDAAGNVFPLIVYVDPAAGSVTFRGKSAPNSAVAGTTVQASYVPLGNRVIATTDVESAPFGFMERTAVQPLSATTNEPIGDANIGVHTASGYGGTEFTLGGLVTGVQVRYGTWDNTIGQGIDRQWLYWQRAGKTAELFYTTRRVGIDLKAPAIAAMGAKESFRLFNKQRDTPTGPVYQRVAVTSVTVGGAEIPFEVDVDNGKIYTQARYEGREITVVGEKVTSGSGAATPVTATATLAFIDEATGLSEAGAGRAVQMAKEKSNENQPYAFIDTFDRSNLPRDPANPELPQSPFDPVLQPGRVWLFWTSARSRTGLVRIPDATYETYFGVPGGTGRSITGNGYNLYWQTLAPNFNLPTTSGYPDP